VAAQNRAQSSSCFYCGVAFSDEMASSQRTVDHRIARSRGGNNALSNLVFACYACNQRKRDLPEDQFVTSEWLARRREETGHSVSE
jgi:5-methylcytosine-specific restriction endonuclease McrA